MTSPGTTANEQTAWKKRVDKIIYFFLHTRKSIYLKCTGVQISANDDVSFARVGNHVVQALTLTSRLYQRHDYRQHGDGQDTAGVEEVVVQTPEDHGEDLEDVERIQHLKHYHH